MVQRRQPPLAAAASSFKTQPAPPLAAMDDNTPPVLLCPGLIGLFISTSTGQFNMELHTLVLLIYFGEMITICNLANTCLGLRHATIIWCHDCWSYCISPRREINFRHNPESRYSLSDLVNMRVNWYCWKCWNSWLQPWQATEYQRSDMFTEWHREEEGAFSFFCNTHGRRDIDLRLQLLMVRKSGGYYHFSSIDRWAREWDYGLMGLRRKYFP